MKKQDINRIYTEKVAELLACGYQINTETMSGSQGEWAHIDLTDGSEILRVLVDSHSSFSEGYDEIVRITVGRCTDRIRGRWDTIWNNHLEIISQIELAKISEDFYTTVEEGKRMAEKRFARWRALRGQKAQDLSPAHKSIALRWLRRQPRMKTCQLADITKMVRTTRRDGTVCYEITAKGKNFSLHA